ncbi:MAG: hypothetical protein J1E42_05615 [Akkermansiaceae bacterium]|nr:hypothetical protein [Akkermansiaceae bacterium]
MLRLGSVVCMCWLALLTQPCVSAANPAPKAEENVGTQLLSVTKEMWFLLSGVVDESSANAAAPKFRELCELSSRMSDRLFDSDAQALDVEALGQDTYRIAEAYEDLSYEFESLCRARCYDSPQLISAFLHAMKLGVFTDDFSEALQTTTLNLSENEAADEISRLGKLEEPDAEVLRVLSRVMDSASANSAVAELKTISGRLHNLLPPHRLKVSNFPEKKRAELARACARLEVVLWKIRCEIVRIASLPGYDQEPFDTFSDALDAVFENMGDTHSECFDDVFDESFRTDLEDALHENNAAS